HPPPLPVQRCLQHRPCRRQLRPLSRKRRLHSHPTPTVNHRQTNSQPRQERRAQTTKQSESSSGLRRIEEANDTREGLSTLDDDREQRVALRHQSPRPSSARTASATPCPSSVRIVRSAGASTLRAGNYRSDLPGILREQRRKSWLRDRRIDGPRGSC